MHFGPRPPFLASRSSSSLLSPADRRSAIAFAEAILPDTTETRGADETTVERLEAFLSAFSPGVVRAWALALRTLDQAARVSTGRPFSELSLERQDALLATWEKHPVTRGPLHLVALPLKTLHFDVPSITEARGRRLETVQALERPRWLSQVHPAQSWSESETIECDVVVIGTGAGGAVVGKELASRGHAVVFVERGEHLRRDSFDGSFSSSKKFADIALSVGNAPMPTFTGRLVGGSTAINTGTCLRTPSFILERWCEELATDEFSPERMAERFDELEAFIGVALPERRFIGPIADVFDRGSKKLGWRAGPVPRNAVGCEGQGFCDFGCATGARRSTDLTFVPAALERSALLLTGLGVDRILVEGRRAVGVSGTTAQGRRLEVRARVVVLAGGAIRTPLLLLSQGIANSSGEVGKNLTLHPSIGLGALFEELIDPNRHVPQGYYSDQFVKEGILLLAAQPTDNVGHVFFLSTGRRLMSLVRSIPHLAGMGILIRDTARGRVRALPGVGPVVTYNAAAEDFEALKRGLAYAAELFFAAGARQVLPGLVGGPTLDRPSDLDAFRRTKFAASQYALTSYHPLGSTRMGRDPRTSVVGLDHQSHDVPGLYVIDGSTVPGPPGVNPQMTIMAMALRAARILAERV